MNLGWSSGRERAVTSDFENRSFFLPRDRGTLNKSKGQQMASELISEEEMREMTIEELGQLALDSQRIFEERLANLRGVSAQWGGGQQPGSRNEERPRRGRRPRDTIESADETSSASAGAIAVGARQHQ